MKRAALASLIFLSACSAKRPAPDPAIEARRACAKELRGKDMHSEEDFLALGRRQEEAGNSRCAEAAFEAATVLAPKDARPYSSLAAVFEKRGEAKPAVHAWIEFQKRVDPDSPEWAAASERINALSKSFSEGKE